MKIKINAPWTDGVQEYDGYLGFIAQAKQQLLFFQKKKDTYHIRQDIKGYDLILKSNNENNAIQFLKAKRNRVEMGLMPIDNCQLIEYLKSVGKWE